MTHSVEAKISNLVASQFPSFYREEGPLFVQFLKAYYEWLEDDDNMLYTARRAMDLRDIDETLESFLIHFQQKYLYGIPFDVIINKRLLLKHVLDVYRSKGSRQCYKLLFRLVYNEDADIYLPGIDVLKLSDGKWRDIRYIESSYSPDLADMIGKTVLGTSSGTTAVVENFIREPINENIITRLFISNVRPRGGNFLRGEKLIAEDDAQATNLSEILVTAPTVLGSLDEIEIINGGAAFEIGDTLKIAHRDLTTDEVISQGVGGIVRVANTFGGRGRMTFSTITPGSGYYFDSKIMLYNSANDTSGSGASFAISSYFDTDLVTYNTDVLAEYLDLTLNAAAYGLPTDPAANLGSTIASSLAFANARFGSIASLGSIRTGSFYTEAMRVFVRSVLPSENLTGTVAYDNTSITVTGTGTFFQKWLAANSTICLVGDTANTDTWEYHVVNAVASNTSLTLVGKPQGNSTGSSKYKVCPPIYWANFSPTNALNVEEDNSQPGNNAVVVGSPATGNGVISRATALISGKGYVEGEFVKMYLYGGLTSPVIANGGVGYANGQSLVFTGGEPEQDARATILTDANGTINDVSLTYAGAGYKYAPVISVRTIEGTGAHLTTTVTEFNDIYEVTGRIRKVGIGKDTGRWETTDGFFNSDKYIHDSYYYQDYSYQINAPLSLNKYRDILYQTFHTAGTEMFGKVLVNTTESANASIIAETDNANSSIVDTTDFNTADTTVLTADMEFMTIDFLSATPGNLYGVRYNGSIFIFD